MFLVLFSLSIYYLVIFYFRILSRSLNGTILTSGLWSKLLTNRITHCTNLCGNTRCLILPNVTTYEVLLEQTSLESLQLNFFKSWNTSACGRTVVNASQLILNVYHFFKLLGYLHYICKECEGNSFHGCHWSENGQRKKLCNVRVSLRVRENLSL